MPTWHHELSHRRFLDIKILYRSFKSILKNCFPNIFHRYNNNIIHENNYSKILVSLREITSLMYSIFRPFQNDIVLGSLASLIHDSKFLSTSESDSLEHWHTDRSRCRIEEKIIKPNIRLSMYRKRIMH